MCLNKLLILAIYLILVTMAQHSHGLINKKIILFLRDFIGVWAMESGSKNFLTHVFGISPVYHLTVHLFFCFFDTPPLSIGPKPFCFEPMWMHDPTFEKVILDAWSIDEQDIKSKLHNVGMKLTHWNTHAFGNVYAKKNRVLATLKGFFKLPTI